MSPALPVTVFATGGQNVNHLDEWYDGHLSDIIDNAYVVLQYNNGSRASLDLCMFAEASQHQEEVVIVGDQGKLEAFLPQLEVRTGMRGCDSLQQMSVKIVDDARVRYRGHHYGSSYLEHLDILSRVRSVCESRDNLEGLNDVTSVGGDESQTAGVLQGMVAVAMGVAAQKSIATGLPVRMDELLTKDELQSCERYNPHT